MHNRLLRLRRGGAATGSSSTMTTTTPPPSSSIPDPDDAYRKLDDLVIPEEGPAAAYLHSYLQASLGRTYDDYFFKKYWFLRKRERYEPSVLFADMLDIYGRFFGDRYFPRVLAVTLGEVSADLTEIHTKRSFLIIDRSADQRMITGLVAKHPIVTWRFVDDLTVATLRDLIEPLISPPPPRPTPTIVCQGMAVLEADFLDLPDVGRQSDLGPNLELENLDRGFDLELWVWHPLELDVKVTPKRGLYAVEGLPGTVHLQHTLNRIREDNPSFEWVKPFEPIAADHGSLLPYGRPDGWPASAHLDPAIWADLTGYYYEALDPGNTYDPVAICEDVLEIYRLFCDAFFIPHAVALSFGEPSADLIDMRTTTWSVIFDETLTPPQREWVEKRANDGSVRCIERLTIRNVDKLVRETVRAETEGQPATAFRSLHVLAAEFSDLPAPMTSVFGDNHPIYVDGVDAGFRLDISAHRPLEVHVSLTALRGQYSVNGMPGTRRLEAAIENLQQRLPNFELDRAFEGLELGSYQLVHYR